MGWHVVDGAALVAAAISAPVVLGDGVAVDVRVDVATGMVAVVSGGRVAAPHLTASVATVAVAGRQPANRPLLLSLRRGSHLTPRVACATIAPPTPNNSHDIHPASGDATLQLGLAFGGGLVVRVPVAAGAVLACGHAHWAVAADAGATLARDAVAVARGALMVPALTARVLPTARQRSCGGPSPALFYVEEGRVVESARREQTARRAPPSCITAGRARFTARCLPHALAAWRAAAATPAMPVDTVVACDGDVARAHSALAKVAAAELGVDGGVSVCGAVAAATARSPHGVWVHASTLAAPVLARAGAVAASSAPATRPPSYLITGGAGAIGSLAALWAAAGGSQRVVCVGRSGRDLPHALAGTCASCISLARCDASTVADAADAAAWAAAASPVHAFIAAGGALADARLVATTPAHLRTASSAKRTALRAAACALAAAPTRTTTALSSVAGLLGSAGQASYGVANVLFDAEVEEMVGKVSLRWGGGEREEERRGQKHVRDSPSRLFLNSPGRAHRLHPVWRLGPGHGGRPCGRHQAGGGRHGRVAEGRWSCSAGRRGHRAARGRVCGGGAGRWTHCDGAEGTVALLWGVEWGGGEEAGGGGGGGQGGCAAAAPHPILLAHPRPAPGLRRRIPRSRPPPYRHRAPGRGRRRLARRGRAAEGTV